jgi:hypothetical protein
VSVDESMMLFLAQAAIESRRDPTASDLTAEVAENAERKDEDNGYQ